MKSNFKKVVETAKVIVSSNYSNVDNEIKFYNGDKEFASFYLWHKFVNESGQDIANLKEKVKAISELIGVENLSESPYKPRISFSYTGKYNGLDLEIVARKSNCGKNKYYIYFKFTGTSLKSDTSFSEFPHITTGSIFSVDDHYFYQVVRRSGNTIYTRQIHKKNVAVTGTRTYEYTPCKDSFFSDKVNRSKIKSFDVNQINVITTIENHHASLWIN